MNRRTLLLLVVIQFAHLAVGIPAGFVDCTTTPRPVPAPSLCWDAPRVALRVNKTLAAFASTPSNALDINGTDVYVPAGATLLLGVSSGLGANVSTLNGSLVLDTNSTLAVTHVNLTINGNLTVGNDATVLLDGTNASVAHIRVTGCLILANASRLQLQINASDGNASRILLLFDVPSGCVVGAFGNVSTVFVQGASTGGGTYPPGSACPFSGGVAVLVSMGCTELPPPPPPPPPPFVMPPAIIIEPDRPAPVPPPPPPPVIIDIGPFTFNFPPGTILPPIVEQPRAPPVPTVFTPSVPSPLAGPSPLVVPPIVYATPATIPTAAANISTGPTAEFDWPLIWTVGCVPVALLIILIAALVIIFKVRKLRRDVLPFRDRTFFKPERPSSFATSGPAPVYPALPPRTFVNTQFNGMRSNADEWHG